MFNVDDISQAAGSARRRPVQLTRRAFTVLELLVSILIMGVLAGLILPAIQAAREAARRCACLSNLRQVGVALQLRHDAEGRFPAGWRTIEGTSTALGWASTLLPHLEQRAVGLLVNPQAPIAAVENAAARATVLSIFVCASDVEEDSFQLFQEIGGHESSGLSSTRLLVELPAANYVGVFGTSDPDGETPCSGEGPFIRDRESTLADFQRGSSHVLFVGERTARKLPSTWLGVDLKGEDAAGRVAGQAWQGPNRADADECEFDSRHPGGVNFLWGDGHVAWLVDEIDESLYRQLARLQE
jgi:prepilin-type processing-associated H-X9-DG protein/prepilin-type N-terminal cleavage/methylation domain-containing protein